MTNEEARIRDEALQFIRENRTRLARELTDPDVYPFESEPVSVFMAGSPGAGKTEASIELLAGLDGKAPPVLRVDPDELRELIPGYGGGNAWLFQEAVSRLVERVVDLAFKQRQSFLLDGTLSSYRVAEKNIHRSIRKGRSVEIIYVYQEPALAWEFVVAREAEEGRRIHMETFVQQYFAAREVVNRIKRHFGKQVIVDLLLKNTDNSNKVFYANVDNVDSRIPEKYDPGSLERMLRAL
ncbi:zeta toxin family protein [Guyparkeria sp. GHLCS8-2]|uniref:zeta toxin family protein n=1 Tax=Guyparkeria halopsychrophila TaxID=3139421 RepID=UPI0037CA1CB0